MMVQSLIILLAFLRAVSTDIAISDASLESGLTDEEMQALLDEHNELRSAVAAGYKGQWPAANMLRMRFSQALQDHAQKQASWCDGPEHGNDDGEGQNYESTAPKNALKNTIDDWFHREQPNYKYGGLIMSNNAHFTQMIWAWTTRIGCGYDSCQNGKSGRLVCNYMRPGNYQTLKPYQKGLPCSACPITHRFCLENLCSTKRQCKGKKCICLVDEMKCKNGKYDESICKCVCSVGFAGINCDEECRDAEYSGCYGRRKKGHCDERSNYYDDAIKNCKPECKLCKAICKDYRKDCSSYKKAKLCTDRWVIAVCAKTCGICH